jgi:hypothetical protein
MPSPRNYFIFQTSAQVMTNNQELILERLRVLTDHNKIMSEQVFELKAAMSTIPGIVTKGSDKDEAHGD